MPNDRQATAIAIKNPNDTRINKGMQSIHAQALDDIAEGGRILDSDFIRAEWGQTPFI